VPRRTRWRRARRRGTVAIGELANRLDDMLHSTAGNREGVAVMVIVGGVRSG
jgi:hypothetical protein